MAWTSWDSFIHMVRDRLYYYDFKEKYFMCVIKRTNNHVIVWDYGDIKKFTANSTFAIKYFSPAFPEEYKPKLRVMLRQAAERKYILKKLQQWKENCHPRTDIFFSELPPMIWKYLREKKNTPMYKKYACRKHKEPKHIEPQFYKWYSAWLVDKCLI